MDHKYFTHTISAVSIGFQTGTWNLLREDGTLIGHIVGGKKSFFQPLPVNLHEKMPLLEQEDLLAAAHFLNQIEKLLEELGDPRKTRITMAVG